MNESLDQTAPEEANTAQTPAQSPDIAANREEDIQVSLAAPFEVRVRQHKARFIASLPELGLLASAKTLEAAHAEVLRQREARIREFASEGLLSSLPRPGALNTTASGPSVFGQLKVFLIKAAVVTVLFLGAVNSISTGLGDIGYVLEKKLAGTATMTPDSVEKHRAQAARIAEKLGPIVREILVMFQTPAPAVAPAAGTPAAPTVEPVPAQTKS